MHQPSKKLFIVIGLHLLAACSGDPTSSENGDANSPNLPPAPGGVFVPENLELIFIQGRELELTALTLQEDAYGAELLVAVRNPGPDFLCEVEVNAALTTADDAELGVATVPVRGSMHDASGVMNCLAPGEVRLGGTYADVYPPVEVAQFARLYYRFSGYLYTQATKITSASIEALTIGALSADSTTVRGRVENRGAGPLSYPEVQVFSLNEMGRPLAQGFTWAENEIAAGASWEFEVLVPGPVRAHAATLAYYAP